FAVYPPLPPRSQHPRVRSRIHRIPHTPRRLGRRRRIALPRPEKSPRTTRNARIANTSFLGGRHRLPIARLVPMDLTRCTRRGTLRHQESIFVSRRHTATEAAAP